MQHIDVALEEHEFAQAAGRAQEAGVSVEAWVRELILHAAVSPSPADPLFGLLADEPELADALDAVVAERSSRRLRAS